MSRWVDPTSPELNPAGLSDFWSAYDAYHQRSLSPRMTRTSERGGSIEGLAGHIRDGLGLLRGSEDGGWGPFEADLRIHAASSVRAGVSFSMWSEVIVAGIRELTSILVETHRDVPARLSAALAAMHGVNGRIIAILGDEYARTGTESRRDGTTPAQARFTPLAEPGSMDVSERKFRSLLENAPDAMVIADTAGRIVLLNAQTEALFGYTREELLGQPVELLIPVRSRATHLGHRASYVTAPNVRGMDSGLDLYGLRKDGSEFPIEISLSPIETEEGLLISSAIRDVSKRKLIETALRLASAELETFSYSVAHDLRAPLRGMNGFAQILLDDYSDKLDEAGRDCLAEIQANAQKMAELIDAILSLSRVSRGEVNREPIDLAAIFRSSAHQLATSERERQVEIVAPDQLLAHADPHLMRALIGNLLSNAWKFTGKVGHGRIELGAADREGVRTYSVRDNGAGFDMAYAGQLFLPFRRLHPAREYPGRGIGLATVQRIVQRHGGRVWAEAAVRDGATFYFTLGEGTSTPRSA